MSIDADIAAFGEPITIIRTAGNISSFFLITTKGVVGTGYDRLAMLPTTSTIVTGDLILHNTDYYLVVALLEKRAVGEFFFISARLFKCNETITIRTLNPTTHLWEDGSVSVKCLIVSMAGTAAEDMGNIIPSYSGADKLYNCFAQSSSGLTENLMISDSASRILKVTKDIDIYFSNGIMKAIVKVE